MNPSVWFDTVASAVDATDIADKIRYRSVQLKFAEVIAKVLKAQCPMETFRKCHGLINSCAAEH